MKAYTLLTALGELEDRLILDAEAPGRPVRRQKPALLPLAAALCVLAALLCGFGALDLGLFDVWLQTPLPDPAAVVRSALEGQLDKDYTLTLQIREIVPDPEETSRVVSRYQGSGLARSRGWSDEYLAEHFLVVRADYRAEYDHTKTFLEDGELRQYFYLTQDVKTGRWTIQDNTSPEPTPSYSHTAQSP